MNTYNKDTERPLDKVVPLSLSNVKTLVHQTQRIKLVSLH